MKIDLVTLVTVFLQSSLAVRDWLHSCQLHALQARGYKQRRF